MGDGGWNVGVGAVVITPREPVRMAGYYFDRLSEGTHDDLYARTVVFESGRGRAALVVLDTIMLSAKDAAEIRRRIEERCGLSAEQALICCTHTHTGPALSQEQGHRAWLWDRAADSAAEAVKDLAPASLLWGRAEERSVSFVRRYRMKDGSVRTNPGLLNPDVDRPLGDIDPDVLTLRVVRGRTTRAVLVNFALHCDTVGGNLISACWPFFTAGVVRDKFSPETEVAFLQGCSGDVNHWNVFRGGHLKGFEEAERIGRILGAAALRALGDEKPLTPGPVRGVRRTVNLPLVRVSAEEYAAAKAEMAKPYGSTEDFTMERVEMAKRVRAFEMRRDRMATEVQALRVGEAAFVGLPCEMFNAVGRAIKAQSPCKPTFVCELANDCVGYVGEAHNYDEGGYELTSAVCAKGSGEILRDAALEAVREARG